MRTALALLAGMLLAAVPLFVLLSEEPPTTDVPIPVDDPALEQRLARIEAALHRLEAQAQARDGTPARRDLPAPRPQPTDATGSGSDRVVRVETEAHRFLALYVQSFAGGGQGSEYFRLAVDAWAHDLVTPIARMIADESRPLRLRQQLISMLGKSRFAGDPAAIGALLDGARTGPDDPAYLAIRALARIGDAETARGLEQMFGRLGANSRKYALATIRTLAGDQVNAIFLRLFQSAPDDPTRAMIIQSVGTSDPAVTGRLLRDAFRHEVGVRKAAAQRLATLYGEPFRSIVDDQLRVESDAGVRALLERARTQMNKTPNHHPLQATGAPNADASRDDIRAWATSASNGGREWLEVGYRTPMRATSIRIHEVCSAGAVVEVHAIDANGRATVVWKGQDPTRTPGVFVVPMQPTAFAVKRVRIVLDTRLRTGWNEIDAVQLVGPNGAAWATTATASSYYGSHRSNVRRR